MPVYDSVVRPDFEVQSFLTKAEESLTSAQDDFAAGRHNSCANRCYFACFQAARRPD
jgi:uncharacterized protein (UPF0332 family)